MTAVQVFEGDGVSHGHHFVILKRHRFPHLSEPTWKSFSRSEAEEYLKRVGFLSNEVGHLIMRAFEVATSKSPEQVHRWHGDYEYRVSAVCSK